MTTVPDSFTYEYRGCTLRYGRGSVAALDELLGAHGLDRALVVTGSHVGANPDLMEPVRAGIGDRLVEVFDGTTPAKRAETVYDGIDVMNSVEPDVLVGVGGGSSLDIARQMSAFAADGRPLGDFRAAAREDGLTPPAVDEPTPVVVIPTTFAGAAVSSGGSVEVIAAEHSPSGDPIRTSGAVMPIAVIEDPDLYGTTPMAALAGSAMNGFNKGLETIYSREATAITDATAVRGLRFLRQSLPRLPDDGDAMDHAVAGSLLVQTDRRTSVVHAFGHGFARRYDVQQGVAHAIMVPHVLRFLFDRLDARRDVIAEGLGLDTEAAGPDDVAAAIVDSVATVRDSLGLPARIRDLDVVPEADLPAIAAFVLADDAMAGAPAGLDPTTEDLESILRAAW